MEQSLTTPPPQSHKVKNILVRYSCSHEIKFNSRYQHPEGSHLLKYFPKYYKSLTLEVRHQNPLLSKAKKIKKLKRFTGLSRENLVPPKLWFDLLANNRKEIEEIPEIMCNKSRIRVSPAWRSFSLYNMKFFLNLRRLSQPNRRSYWTMSNSKDLFCGGERCLDYLWGLRKLRCLEIIMNLSNFGKVEWFLKDLNGMSKLLDRLEDLSLKVKMKNRNVQELFQNKNVISHLTNLSLFAAFHPIFAEIPQMCKKLNFLSLNFEEAACQRPEFLSSLASLRHSTDLNRLKICWSGDARTFCTHFKPNPSLRHLQLIFADGLFKDKSLPEGDFWEEIEELDVLGLNFCGEAEDIGFVRSFVTMVLKKVRRLKAFKLGLWMYIGPSQAYEPFLVEEVPHLYESLEDFELSLYDRLQRPKKFDLKMMNPFRKLKVLKLKGNRILYDHIEEAVSLLEKNQKEGDYPVLESTIYLENGQDWLGDAFKKMSEVKRTDRNLKIFLELNFRSRHYVDVLEGLYRDFRAIKGLEIHLICFDVESFPVPVDEIKEFFSRAHKIRNWRVSLDNGSETWEFIKVDGEKEQFFVDRP